MTSSPAAPPPTANQPNQPNQLSVVPEPVAAQPDPSPELDALYAAFDRQHMVPLWTEIGELMPMEPTSRAVPHAWQWGDLLPLAQESGRLVPVGRGGERRAIALANPGLGGRPFATPTMWAAIQYLCPGEVAPEHRHTQNAFRFVVEGEGVWTVVDGDPVAMRRGDLLLTAGWHFHGHHNIATEPMAWLDGLDIPFAHGIDSTFFEFGPEQVSSTETPDRSRSEQLWGHPGLQPLSQVARPAPSSPLAAYRWEHTDRALADQLALEDAGHAGVVEPGHAAIRFANPATGADVMATLRTEFHRQRAGAATVRRQEVGSSVWQVFTGRAEVTVGDRTWDLAAGDLFVVPSWVPFTIGATEAVDLFRFSDTPIYERLHLDRVQVAGQEQ